MYYSLKFSAQSHVLDLEVVILKVYQDLSLVHVGLDLNLEADHAAIQDLSHVQVVVLHQVAVLIQVVGLVLEVVLILEAVLVLEAVLILEVVLYHVAVQSQIVDQGLVQLLVLNHVHGLVVSQHQDRSLVVILLPILRLIQQVDLHQIHLQGPNLEADLPDPGNPCNYIY